MNPDKIRFRWPEEVTQHAEPQYLNDRNRKSDEYLDKWPGSLF